MARLVWGESTRLLAADTLGEFTVFAGGMGKERAGGQGRNASYLPVGVGRESLDELKDVSLRENV